MSATQCRRVLAGVLLGATGCAGTLPPAPMTGVVIPAEDTVPVDAPAREPPPASAPAKPYHFPKVAWAELPNGLRVATVPGASVPIVQIRVVIVGAGRAADGERTGLARLTAELLRDGGAGPMSARELAARVAALGGELTIETSMDATKLGLAVTPAHLGEALGLLGAMVGRPQLAGAELEKLKKRESDRLADEARTKGAWGASMVLYQDLFALPSEHHPYASFSATPAQVERITGADVRSFHRQFYVPRSMVVIVAGATTPDAVVAAAKKAFGGLTGGESPSASFTDPVAPEERKITLVDRPKSSQSDLYVGVLGPARSDPSFPAFAVANQILGGGVTGRLFADLREKRGLAYATRSVVTELAHGPSVVVAYAGTQTAKTGLALAGLLENTSAITERAASEEEVAIARRFLADAFAVHLETVGAVADELARLHVLGLPDDYDETYRKELADVTGATALKAAGDHLRRSHEVIVVAGDAEVIGPVLARFGEVKVVDPTRDFARVRTIPMDTSAVVDPGP
jgi:predicted Zn-dependent peptidase